MKGTVLRKPSAKAAPYWGMLRGLSKPLKLELVVLLAKYPTVDVAAMGFPVHWQQEPLWQ